MTIDIIGPLIESCLVGGLTAVLLAYEHSNAKKIETKGRSVPEEDLLKGDEQEIKEFLRTKWGDGKKNKKLDPLLIPAGMFFLNELTIAMGYIFQNLNCTFPLYSFLQLIPTCSLVVNLLMPINMKIVFLNVTISSNAIGIWIIYIAYIIFLTAIIYLVSRFRDINYIIQSKRLED
jgi:uncharacterized membrane protein (GlpM family)